MTGAGTGSIRCEIASSHADLAAPLLRSFVHHHCVLADCDVSTVDALEAAVAEVAHTIARRHGLVTAIELASDVRVVDIRLSIGAEPDRAPPAFRRGPAARAARLSASFVDDGQLRLVHRFASAGAP